MRISSDEENNCLKLAFATIVDPARMISISPKPISAGQARMYHARELTSEKQNYWSQDQRGHSEWQGKLAEKWDLKGSIGNEEFAHLTEGQPYVKDNDPTFA